VTFAIFRTITLLSYVTAHANCMASIASMSMNTLAIDMSTYSTTTSKEQSFLKVCTDISRAVENLTEEEMRVNLRAEGEEALCTHMVLSHMSCCICVCVLLLINDAAICWIAQLAIAVNCVMPKHW
jgi:hypothetical protein